MSGGACAGRQVEELLPWPAAPWVHSWLRELTWAQAVSPLGKIRLDLVLTGAAGTHSSGQMDWFGSRWELVIGNANLGPAWVVDQGLEILGNLHMPEPVKTLNILGSLMAPVLLKDPSLARYALERWAAPGPFHPHVGDDELRGGLLWGALMRPLTQELRGLHAAAPAAGNQELVMGQVRQVWVAVMGSVPLVPRLGEDDRRWLRSFRVWPQMWPELTSVALIDADLAPEDPHWCWLSQQCAASGVSLTSQLWEWARQAVWPAGNLATARDAVVDAHASSRIWSPRVHAVPQRTVQTTRCP